MKVVPGRRRIEHGSESVVTESSRVRERFYDSVAELMCDARERGVGGVRLGCLGNSV